MSFAEITKNSFHYKSKWLGIICLLFTACSPIRGCVESQFTLAPDSRLPSWFSTPSEYDRNNITVELLYYVPPHNVDNAVMNLVTLNGKTLSTITGEVCWHPVTTAKRNKHGGFDPDSYPHYVYLRAHGITEVFEHNFGPTFRVKDDPALTRDALQTIACDRG